METALKRVRAFVRERNWEQFHTPDNLAKSISIEAGELLECFQWEPDRYEHRAVTCLNDSPFSKTGIQLLHRIF